MKGQCASMSAAQALSTCSLDLQIVKRTSVHGAGGGRANGQKTVERKGTRRDGGGVYRSFLYSFRLRPSLPCFQHFALPCPRSVLHPPSTLPSACGSIPPMKEGRRKRRIQDEERKGIFRPLPFLPSSRASSPSILPSSPCPLLPSVLPSVLSVSSPYFLLSSSCPLLPSVRPSVLLSVLPIRVLPSSLLSHHLRVQMVSGKTLTLECRQPAVCTQM